MSKYTTEVRFICESKAGLDASVGYNSIDEIVTTAAPLIFNFDFPIYDENYRLPLEKRILKHYYTREISEETVGLWQLRLEDRMNLIMPYYNELYKSTLIDFNPLYDVDYKDEHNKKNDDTRNSSLNREENISKSGGDTETQTSNSSRDETSNVNISGNKDVERNENKEYKDDETNNGNTSNERTIAKENSETENNQTDTINNKSNNNWDLFSDTPQSGIDGVMKAGSNLSANGYLTNARNQIESGNDVTGNKEEKNSTSNEESSDKFKEHTNNVTGKSGNASTTDASKETNSETQNRVNGITENGALNSEKTYNDETTNNVRSNENTVIGSLEDYAQHVYGKRGGATYSKMILEFRDTFIKIDQMILDDLSDLFFGLW